MSEPAQAHCLRCDHEVEIEHRYTPRLRRLLKGYFIMPVVLVPLFPFIAWDYVFFLPMFMLYVVGMGPALSIIKDPATCSVCGAYIPVAAKGIDAPPRPGRRARSQAHRLITRSGDHDSNITLRVRATLRSFAPAPSA